jgi:hypothetical protein
MVYGVCADVRGVPAASEIGVCGEFVVVVLGDIWTPYFRAVSRLSSTRPLSVPYLSSISRFSKAEVGGWVGLGWVVLLRVEKPALTLPLIRISQADGGGVSWTRKVCLGSASPQSPHMGSQAPRVKATVKSRTYADHYHWVPDIWSGCECCRWGPSRQLNWVLIEQQPLGYTDTSLYQEN